MEYEVTFTDSCRYEIDTDQSDINKLFGVGYFPHHHKNSVRFGWRWYNDRLEVLAYWYQKGVRSSSYICDVELNTPTVFRIDILRDVHILTVMGNPVKTDILVPGRWFGYFLRPYFGGNRVAPHNITIKLRRL